MTRSRSAARAPPAAAAARPVDPKVEARLGAFKTEGAAGVDDLNDFTQKMVDSVFSFGELGFQEIETSRYLTNILRQQGFTVEEGISGIPTAWMATWGVGQAGHRARFGYRRHPDGIAEAGRGVSRSVLRGRAGARRRTQLRHAAEHHRGHRGEEDHAARENPGNDQAVARGC